MTDAPSRRRNRALDALPMLALLAGFAWVWQERVLRSASTFELTSSDLYAYFWPAYAFEAHRLRAGALPLWNPQQGAGVPFLAMLQPGALYPARLLLLWLDVPTAMHWSTVLHVALLGLGIFVLVLRLGCSRAGALAAAIMAGMTMGLPCIYWPSFLEAVAWLPIAALGVLGIAADGRRRWVLLAGVATGMPVLAGGYQVALYVAYALAILGLGLMLDGRVAVGVPRFLLLGGLAACIAIGTAAPQLFTTLAWTRETIRQTTPLTDAQIQPWAFFNWRFFRHALFTREQPMQFFYVSTPVTMLALVGFATGRRLGRTLGIAAAVAVVLVCGPSTPFFVLYRWLPGFAMFRLPERLLLLFYFLIALGLAFGVTWLGGRFRGRHAASAIAVETLCLAVVVWWLVVPHENRSALPWVNPPDGDAPLRATVAQAKATAPDARLWIPTISVEHRLGSRLGMLDDALVFQDYEPLSSRRLSEYAHAVAGTTPPAPERVRQTFTGAIPPPNVIARPVLLDLVAVGALVVSVKDPLPARAPALVPEQGAGRVALVRSPGLPRAYLVPAAAFVADERLALTALCDGTFTGRDRAVVVGTPVGPIEQAVAAGDPGPFATAAIADVAPERVVVTVAPERPALLVLADAIAPGWAVTVDGVQRRLLQTNYLVRGVAVQPGDRTVEFTYSAPGFRAGLLLAAITWTIVAILVLRRGVEAHA